MVGPRAWLARQELRRALDFLMLVRNDLHYSDKKSSDNLTLRAQGTVAKNLNYPGQRVTAKIAKVYSPVTDLAMPMGRKPAAVMSVPVSMGMAVTS